MNLILLFLLCLLAGCSGGNRYAGDIERKEREAITDSTVTVDMEECMVEQRKLSELICDVNYLELEATEGSYLSTLINLKLTDSLIYAMDLDEHLRCFRRDGTFLRNGYKKGRGHGEVIRLYDFDVDKDYLYLLDGARSAIIRYTHDGCFVDQNQLSFRATRFKQMYNGWYLFELSPFTLTDEEESYSIVVTDGSFTIRKKYFPSLDRDKVVTMTRTPYFENSAASAWFAPLHQRGIYEFKDSVLSMKYYLDFGTPYYEPGRKVKGWLEAQEKGIYYTNYNPLRSRDYLIQNFYTSKDMKGLFLYDLKKERGIMVRDIVNDTDDVIRFDFDYVKYYDVEDGFFVGLTDVYFKGLHSDKEIEEGTSHLSNAAKSVLLREEGEEGINPILMFYRFKKDIVK